ncbi:sigma-70 family RNA polymerase sigma factor [candidate division FCPU426 bacterium]|nr:sigma-70 family RNA polymerase sigma factor [candidate division FCPU426 bacterium]
MTTLGPDMAARFKAGDLAALRQVVEAYQHRLFGMGMKLFGKRDEAADFCQDAFLRAFEKRKTYDAARPFEPWFFKVALNVGRAKMRRRREIPMGDDLPEGKVDARGEEDLLQEESRHRVRQALARVKPKYRESLLLRFDGDLSLKEIAKALGISEGTVKSRLNRGLRAFQKAYVREVKGYEMCASGEVVG